jgi:hypothetical protein
VGKIVHAAMEPSVEEARAYLEGKRFDGYVFSDLTRYNTVTRIMQIKLPQAVRFEKLRNNGMEFLCNGCLARVWKGDEDGKLQGPGNSESKRAFFDQDSLFPPEDPTQFRFGIVWDYAFDTGLFKLALACPKLFDSERPWKNPECHFYIPFPDAATEIKAAEIFGTSAGEEIPLTPKRKVEDGSNSEPDK